LVTWASFSRKDFRLEKGVPKELSWAGRIRGFCPECGTQLFFLSAPDALEIDITVCSLDDPALIEPQDHTWFEDRIPWIKCDDGLPRHEHRRTG
jgi:hypothetical protein